MRGRKVIAVLVFSILAILVVIGIILMVAGFGFPIFSVIKMRRDRAAALDVMRQLGSASGVYMAENDGALPAAGSKGADTWAAAANPENANAWYNVLPRKLGHKGVDQYAANPLAFYSTENILFLPGAQYPESDKKLARPLFAIAINEKLQGKDDQREKPVKLAQITHPGRTVLFLEQGLPNERKAAAQQRKYDGSPKGSAKTFVARYGGSGLMTFVDGHVEFIDVNEVEEEFYGYKFPAQPEKVVWRGTREENPNRHPGH